MKKLILFLLLGLTISSCKNLVWLTVTEPPIIYVSDQVKSVAVINRSMPTGETNKVVDIIDKGLSGEGPNLDKEGANSSVQGCFDELTRSGRFEQVQLLDSLPVQSPGQGIMPAALTWEEVEKICLQNDAQVLFVLEAYDTDTRIDYSTSQTTIKNPLGADIPAIKHHAKMTTQIRQGWRIYDPSSKTILDQFFMKDNIVNSSSGINPAKAAAGLIGRKEAVKQVSNQAAHAYVERIYYQRIRVSRQYYTKGSQNLKIGRRRSQVNDWDGAAEMWMKDTESPKRKVAGRACYNMAISSEINGDLDAAIDWAQKSYTDYRIKLGRDYARLLTRRKNRIDAMRALEESDGN